MVMLSMKDWFQIQFITVTPIYFSHMAKPKKGHEKADPPWNVQSVTTGRACKIGDHRVSNLSPPYKLDNFLLRQGRLNYRRPEDLEYCGYARYSTNDSS